MSRWTENYIDDAATYREVIYRRDGSVVCPSASNYETPETGVHLCGQTDDGEQPTTVASYPMRADEAKQLWDAARQVAECPEDEGDFLVDLCLPEGITDDFYSNRQLWPRAINAWNLEQSK